VKNDLHTLSLQFNPNCFVAFSQVELKMLGLFFKVGHVFPLEIDILRKLGAKRRLKERNSSKTL